MEMDADEREEIERTAYLEDKRHRQEEQRLQNIEMWVHRLEDRVAALEKASIYPA